jgi:hypothetical protein
MSRGLFREIYAPYFNADLNHCFHEAPKSGFNASPAAQDGEDLDLILTLRVPRRVSNVLTLQCNLVIYMLADTVENRKLTHKYLDVFEYPDGRVEKKRSRSPLYRYDRASQIDQSRGHRASTQELAGNARRTPGPVLDRKRTVPTSGPLGRCAEVMQLQHRGFNIWDTRVFARRCGVVNSTINEFNPAL